MELRCDTTVVQLWCEITVVSIVVRYRYYKIVPWRESPLAWVNENDLCSGEWSVARVECARQCARHLGARGTWDAESLA